MKYSAGTIENDSANLVIDSSNIVQRNLFEFKNVLLKEIKSRGETRSHEPVAETKYTFVIHAKVQVGSIIHEVNNKYKQKFFLLKNILNWILTS